MKTTTFYAASAGCGAMRGLGEDVTPKTCNFASHTHSDEAQAVQHTLRLMGATGIKEDGLWGACSESAYAKVFDEVLSAASLEKWFGIKCAKLNKAFAGSTVCKDGSDTVDPTYTKAPPGGGGGQTVAPTSMQSLLAKIAPSKPSMTVSKVSPTLVSSAYRGSFSVASATSSEQTLIPGVPNYAVTIGGLAVLGVVGWFGYKAMTK